MPPFHEILFWKGKIFLPERAILAAHLDEKAGKRYNPLRSNRCGTGQMNAVFTSLCLNKGKMSVSPGTRLRDFANAVYHYVDVGHCANQEVSEQARRIGLMCAAYGWNDPIALITDFEADVQQVLRNHEQAGRTGAIQIFAEEVAWMRQRAQELRRAFQQRFVRSRAPFRFAAQLYLAPGVLFSSQASCQIVASSSLAAMPNASG